MCRQVACKKCGKTTWAGCGMHVSQVMAGVPKSQRCPGHPQEPRQGSGWMGSLRKRMSGRTD